MEKKIRKLLIGIGIVFIITILLISLYKPSEPRIIPIIPAFPNTIPSDDVNNGNVTLNAGWNIISMPNSMPRDNISFTYEGMPYSWNEAVADELIWNVLWGFNGTDYIMVDYLIRTKGYWLCCIEEPIYISHEPLVLVCGKLMFNGTENITCNKVIISPELYDNTIYVDVLNCDEIEFYYYDVGMLRV